ncbi:MAG: hypothetical protein JO314_06310 [Acidobacteria bacterium]|nr:hypothetical protein [Acidobacteriota bacterium]
MTFNPLLEQLGMNVNGLARWVRMTVSGALAVVVFATSSFFALAQVPFTGELLVSGNSVTVNGEAAANGRTIVVPSNIVTGAGSYATLNFANVGKIQVSPGSTFTIDGSGTTLRGSLSAGSVTIVNSVNPVTITTLCGKTVTANTGDTVSADQVCGTGGTGNSGHPAGGSKSTMLIIILAAAGGGIIAAVAAGGGGGTASGTT